MTTKVMVSFPDKFLKEVDHIAEEEHRSRSELLREAMRLYIVARRGGGQPGADPRVQASSRSGGRGNSSPSARRRTALAGHPRRSILGAAPRRAARRRWW